MEVLMTFSKKKKLSTLQYLRIICKIGLSSSLRALKTIYSVPTCVIAFLISENVECLYNRDAQKDRCLFLIRITVMYTVVCSTCQSIVVKVHDVVWSTDNIQQIFDITFLASFTVETIESCAGLKSSHRFPRFRTLWKQ